MSVRRIGIAVAALAAGAAALLLLAHAPLVRSAALRYALVASEQRYGLRLEAARLDYNLAALRIGLADIRLSALHAASQPFFEADYLSVTLPLRSLLGDLAFQDIRATNARVFVRRQSDGTTNLPHGSDRPRDEPPPLRIERLDIPQLAIDLRDDQADISLLVPALTLLVTPDEGYLTLGRPAALRAGAQVTRISELKGHMAFDGRALRFLQTQVRSDEASVVLEGSLLLMTSEPAVELRLKGTGDLAGLARWGISEGEVPRGELAFEAQITGALSDVRADLGMTTARASWQGVAATDLSARLRLTTAGADVEEVRFGLEGGRLTASGFVPFEEGRDGRVHASWTGINAASATRALAPGVELVPNGSLSGELDVQGAMSNPMTWSGSVRIDAAPARNARGRIAVGGDTAVQLSEGTWRLDGRHVLGGVTPVTVAVRGRLGGGGPEGPPLQRALSQATIVQGAVQLGQTDLPALLAALRTAGVADVDVDALTAGTFEADIRLTGALTNPSIEGRAHVRNAVGPQFEVKSLDTAFSGMPLQARLEFTIDAPDAVVAGQRLNDVRSAGRFAETVFVLEELSASQPSGSGLLKGAGAYNVRSGQFTATFDGAQWELTSTADRPIAGRATVRFMGAGTLEEPRGTGRVTLQDAMWQDIALGELDASVQLDGQSAQVEARAPELGATAAARVQITAPYRAVVDARAGDLDLARVLRDVGTPTPIAGTATLAIRMEGPLSAWRSGSASLEIASLNASAGELQIRLVEPARARYAADRVHVDRLEATAGETSLSAYGELPLFDAASDAPGVLVTMDGDVGEVARAAAATGLTEIPIAGGDGPVVLLSRLTGSLQAPLVAADLEVGPGSVTLQDLPPVSGLRIRAHAEHGWIELREGAASYQSADLSVTGRAPLSLFTGQGGAVAGAAGVRARAANVTPAIFAPFLDPTTLEQISGSVDATLEASSPTLDLADLAGELRIDRLDVRVADLPVTQRVPTRVVARDGLARIEAWDWAGQGATLAVRGQVRLNDRQSAILANGVVDLRVLTPFVRDAGLTTAGRLEPRLSITGTLDNPRIDGDLIVTGGEVRFVDPRMLVSDLAVRTVLTRTTARITSLTGTVNGGALTGTGGFDYGPGGRLDGQLSTSVRGMALEFPDGLRSELDATLDLALDVGADVVGADLQVRPRPSGRLSGTVTAVRSTYREPLAVVTGLLAALGTRRLAAGPAADSTRLLEALMLDVRLLTDEDVIVDNNYGRFQIGADLRVIGTAAAPALSGRAELREGGQFFVGRNVYTISAGTVDFANPVIVEPDLTIDLRTRAAGHEIQVTVAGTPDNLAVEQRSLTEPDLGQAEVASLLLTGRRLEDLAPGDAAFVGTQVLGNFSAEVLGFASRAVGLDTLRLGGVDNTALRRDPTAVATELDPTTRLTFGKSLGPDVDVTVSQSLRESDAQTWIVEYVPTRGLELRLVSDDSDLRSYGFRHDMAFGGASRAIRPAAGPGRRQAMRVVATRISGDLGIAEARVREALRLSAGDRFDFVAWQADRDRLEAMYRRQGYLAARVTATRVDGPEGVSLEYQVAAGPQTRIVATGMELTPALRSRLETAWFQSVFDDFLIDEATQIVRDELALERYLRPAVDVRVLEERNTKTLTIAVDRGERTERTIVRVEGAEEPLATGINARLAERGLIDRAASDPGGVEREVAAYLQTNGYLRARVTAGAPLFEESGVVVPVSVDAGPAFTIASVVFAGAQGLAEDLLRDTAALAEGMPYDPAALEEARDRLVALHRREGFVSASVTARPDVRAEVPRVEVTFVVDTGARQVLGEVVVAGNRAIDSDVIVRALDLAVNAPLRAEDVLRARTRVFDTGLFRRIDVAPEPDALPAADDRVMPVRLRVTVEEWPALRLRYGFRLAEERPDDQIEGRNLVPGLTADLTRRTLFRRAITVGGAVAWQRRERLGRAFMNTATLFGLPIESSLIAERSREEFAAVTLVTDRTSLTWEQRTRVGRGLALSYAYRFERNHTFDTDAVPNPDFPAFDVAVNLGRVTGSAAWDTRNDPSDTTRGSLFSSSLEYAPEAVGSDIRFVRQLAQAYHFRPWGSLVLASAARFGVAVPLGGQELIPSERFFAGGARSVRGVAEGALGERNVFGDPAGGRALVLLNQEVRMPMYRWLRGVGFVDAGNVFTRPGDADVRALVGSVGFGLRLASPFALLRADYAKPVWGASTERAGRWSFGIGHAF